MDLNEKLAARRRELAIEAEKVALADAERRKEEAIKAAAIERAEDEAIDAEVAKRLAEKGITLPAPSALPTPIEIPESLVDAEVEKAISSAASARMTGGENAKFTILLLLGIGGFFIAWWVGLAFIVWAASYISKTTARYREQIIEEGKAKMAETTPVVENHPAG